ncbi:hypothetical protein IF2G_06244 [Cordyceps javanica]|nr:hypothetical protein IF2G_06244 [Cordyceps javanica]
MEVQRSFHFELASRSLSARSTLPAACEAAGEAQRCGLDRGAPRFSGHAERLHPTQRYASELKGRASKTSVMCLKLYFVRTACFSFFFLASSVGWRVRFDDKLHPKAVFVGELADRDHRRCLLTPSCLLSKDDFLSKGRIIAHCPKSQLIVYSSASSVRYSCTE